MTTTNAQIKKFEKEFLKEKGYGSIRYEDRYEWASFISQKSAETEKLRKAEPIFLQEFEKSIRASECQRVAKEIFEKIDSFITGTQCREGTKIDGVIGVYKYHIWAGKYNKLKKKYGGLNGRI